MANTSGNLLKMNLQTIDNKVRWSAGARGQPEIVIDYPPPIGSGDGYTSLEVFLASFGSCVGSVLLTLLRHRMKKSVGGISAEATGTVREEHPKAFQHILLSLTISAADLTEAEVRQMLKVAEDTMCPVWAMIKGNVAVDVEVNIRSVL